MKWHIDTEKLTEEQTTQITLQLFENTKTIGLNLKKQLDEDLKNAIRNGESLDKIQYLESFNTLVSDGITKAEVKIEKYLKH